MPARQAIVREAVALMMDPPEGNVTQPLEAVPHSDAPELPLGYVFERELGFSRSGRVVRARRESDGLVVVIKTLMGSQHDPAFVRLVTEARQLARITHPRIVRLLDFQTQPYGASLIIELVGGGTLREEMNSSPLMSVTRVVSVGLDLVEGLEEIHRMGLIHRDLKPENILCDEDRRVKIADFGLVRAQAGRAGVTEPGTAVGSPRYMAPEQIRGDGVGPSTDFYSLGVLLHEMFAGQPPFDSASVSDLLAMHLGAQPPPLGDRRPGCGRELAGLVDLLLSKSAVARPTAAQVRSVLLEARRTQRPEAAARLATPGAPGSPARRVRATGILRSPLKVLAVALVSAFVVLVGGRQVLLTIRDEVSSARGKALVEARRALLSGDDEAARLACRSVDLEGSGSDEFLRILATVEMRSESWKPSLAHWTRLLEVDPSDSEAQEGLCLAARLGKSPTSPQATTALRRLERESAAGPALTRIRLTDLMLRGDVGALLKAMPADPAPAPWWQPTLQGDAVSTDGRLDSAPLASLRVSRCREALRDALVRRFIATALMEQGLVGPAVQLLGSATWLAPECPRGWIQLARALIERAGDRPVPALPELPPHVGPLTRAVVRTVLSSSTPEAASVVELLGPGPRATTDRALLLAVASITGLRRWPKLTDQLVARAASLAPFDAVGLEWSRVQILIDSGRLEEAQGCLERLPRDAAGTRRIDGTLAEVLRRRGLLDAAAERLEALSRSRPHDLDLLLSQCNLALDRSRFQEGLDLARRAVEVSGNSWPARRFLTRFLGATGRTLEQIVELNRCLIDRPRNVDALGDLAAACRSLGRFKEAEEHYKAILRIDPERNATRSEFGRLLLDQGRMVDAAVQFGHATRSQRAPRSDLSRLFGSKGKVQIK